MRDPFRARVFVIGMNQSREYPAGQISHERHLDALFNRNGETCRGLYDLVTIGKASRTRRNIDRLTDRLNRQGVQDVLETDVICYSTRMSRDLRNLSHAGGVRKGDEIFRYLLEQIMPPVLIVHGVGAGKRVAAILGIDHLKIPQNADEVCEIQTDRHLIIPIPSLSLPASRTSCPAHREPHREGRTAPRHGLVSNLSLPLSYGVYQQFPGRNIRPIPLKDPGENLEAGSDFRRGIQGTRGGISKAG